MAAAEPFYAMGRSEHEKRRLIAQAQLYNPFTRQLFIEAGIGRGMDVLDLGSGAGDVALIAAELVGPSGRVVAVDSDEAILTVAASRARALGMTNIEFVTAYLDDLALDQAFDAAVSRFFVAHQPDPAGALRRAASFLRPGGVLVSQEHDWLSEAVATPSSPLWQQFRHWIRETIVCIGLDVDISFHLHQHYVAAGLPGPELRLDAPVGSAETWAGYTYAEGSLRSALPLMEQHSVTTAAEVAVDTFAARLFAETGAKGGTARATPVMGAWARKA